ncbi:hypothetical protein GP486_001264 [Trichoglossum hirsutum]|uniref:Uncharacterized protein n=1 Tax=Trichoglossum hirsutum TaxID=265104 RepID=A0A9P8LH68_9PEZI|nr:hypothetical protein GP486_001264 [Trichoglossum hirsutum]
MSYYNLMETLINFGISNKELLTAFTDAREIAISKIAAGAAGLGISALAGAGSFTTFAAGDVVAAATFGPSTLSWLGVSGAAGAIEFLVPATLCTNPMLLGGAVLAGVASLTVIGVKNKSRKKYNAMSDDCKKIHDLLHAAYREAWLASNLIMLVHCTEGGNYEFANRASRVKWEEYITSKGGEITVDLSPSALVLELQNRADVLEASLIDTGQVIEDLWSKVKKS